MGCLFFIIAFVLFYTVLSMAGIESFWGTIAFMVIAAFVIILWEKSKTEKEESVKNEILKKENDYKNELYRKYRLPVDCVKYKHAGGYSKFPNGRWVHVWRENDFLNLLSNKEEIEKHQIPLSDIKFYSVKGDVRQETETTGGNATVAETVMAEGLLGTAAAIKKNQPQQTTKTIDERKTIINATIELENKFIFFEGADLYNYLLENIPEKEQSFVAMNK